LREKGEVPGLCNGKFWESFWGKDKIQPLQKGKTLPVAECPAFSKGKWRRKGVLGCGGKKKKKNALGEPTRRGRSP